MWPKMWLEICVIYIPSELEWEFLQTKVSNSFILQKVV